MKSRWILVVLLLAALVLNACSSSAPAPANPSATQAPVEGYPAPGQQDQQPAQQGEYPAPGSQAQLAAPTAGVNPAVLYPDPQSGSAVTWEQAKAMILNGEATEIILQNLDVTLNLRDGRSLLSTVPNADEVSVLLQLCGEICKDTKLTQ